MCILWTPNCGTTPAFTLVLSWEGGRKSVASYITDVSFLFASYLAPSSYLLCCSLYYLYLPLSRLAVFPQSGLEFLLEEEALSYRCGGFFLKKANSEQLWLFWPWARVLPAQFSITAEKRHRQHKTIKLYIYTWKFACQDFHVSWNSIFLIFF